MNQHTAGPWRLVLLPDGSFQIVTENGIALVAVGRAGWQPDADLMVAAPELLAFVRYVANLNVGDDPDGSVFEGRMQDPAKELLAKIEGR